MQRNHKIVFLRVAFPRRRQRSPQRRPAQLFLQQRPTAAISPPDRSNVGFVGTEEDDGESIGGVSCVHRRRRIVRRTKGKRTRIASPCERRGIWQEQNLAFTYSSSSSSVCPKVYRKATNSSSGTM
ncbi:unnamed protein product [Ixodes pacificus]